MNILNVIRRGVYKVGFETVKHAPELLLAGGITCSVAAIGVAVIKTDEAKAVMDIGEIRKENSAKMCEDGTMSVSEYKRDAAQITVQTFFGMTKVFSPVLALEGASIAMLLISHGIMRRRLAAMASAYAALNTAFANYRGRIRSLYGNEVDQYALTGVKPVELPEGSRVDGETLKQAEKTKLLDRLDSISPYARYFTKESRQWKHDMGLNMMYLRGQERYLNQRLHLKGYLLLNEVYDVLDMPPTPEGCVVGWWDDPATGDGYIDLGLTGGVRAVTTPGLDGYEHAVLINPNVDGPIYERMRTIKPEYAAMITPGNTFQEIGIARPEGVEFYGQS